MDNVKLKLELIETQIRLLQAQLQILHYQKQELQSSLPPSDMPSEADLSLNK